MFTESVGPISPSLNTPFPRAHSKYVLEVITQPCVFGSIRLYVNGDAVVKIARIPKLTAYKNQVDNDTEKQGANLFGNLAGN